MDPYQILGVSPSASDQEISDAYRRLARKYHPDLNKDNPAAEEKMKEINAAYGRIQDIRSGKAPPQNPGFDPQGQNPYSGYGPFGNQTGGYGPYGYGPFGPYRTYRTYRTVRRMRPFSLFRFLLTLMILSFLMRACALLSFQFIPSPTDNPPSYHRTEPQNGRPSEEI